MLGEIAKILEGAATKQKKRRPRWLQLIRFIKEGQKPNTSVKDKTGVLATANDWQIRVDLTKRLIFPQEIYMLRASDRILFYGPVEQNKL